VDSPEFLQFLQWVMAAVVIVVWVGARRFQPWAFKIGLPVVHDTRSLPRPPQAVGSEFQTETARFKMIAPQLCLFCYPGASVPWLRRKRYSPVIKGTIGWNDGQATMHGRISLGPLLISATLIAFPFIPSASVPADVKYRLLIMWAPPLWGGLSVLFLWHFVRGARRIPSEFELAQPRA
jgi:hypothetical protein